MRPETLKALQEALAKYKTEPHEISNLGRFCHAFALWTEDVLVNEAPHDFKDNRP